MSEDLLALLVTWVIAASVAVICVLPDIFNGVKWFICATWAVLLSVVRRFDVVTVTSGDSTKSSLVSAVSELRGPAPLSDIAAAELAADVPWSLEANQRFIQRLEAELNPGGYRLSVNQAAAQPALVSVSNFSTGGSARKYADGTVEWDLALKPNPWADGEIDYPESDGHVVGIHALGVGVVREYRQEPHGFGYRGFV